MILVKKKQIIFFINVKDRTLKQYLNESLYSR